MSKRRRGRPREQGGEQGGEQGREQGGEPAEARRSPLGSARGQGGGPVAEQAHGNQAAQAQLAPIGRGPAIARATRSLADHVGLALSVDTMDRARTEALIEHVSRSELPESRRIEIREHLHTSQEAADEVAAAMARWCGGDDPAQRSAMIAALEQLEGAGVSPQGSIAEAAEVAVASALQAAAPQLSEASARGLCSQLALMVELVWDEEEGDEAAPRAPDPTEATGG